MPVTLLSTQVPTPPTSSGFLRVADATASNGNAPTAKHVISETYWRQNTINPNFTQANLAERYGSGGAYAVAYGLVLSAGSGLTLNVAKGHAMVDGVVEVPADTTIAVPDGHNTATDRVWVWVNTAGTISIRTDTTAVANAAVLGSCTTNAGAITAVDTSGVVYVRGGDLYREVVDDGALSDTPPSGMIIWTKAGTNWVWLWNGGAYRQIGVPQLTADPGVLANGMFWYRTDLDKMSTRTGGATKRSAAYT